MVQPYRSSAVERALALAGRSAITEAYGVLTAAVAAGDALAAATLAEWRMAGDPIRRDIGEARSLYGKAADLGLAAAEPIYTALLASGAGDGRRDWAGAIEQLGKRAPGDPAASRQLALLAAMAIDDQGNPLDAPTPEVIRAAPRIVRLRGFLSGDECRYLCDLARPSLQPALVVHPHTGQLVPNPVRTSRSASFPFVLEDPVVHAINRRIAAATGTEWSQGEPMQVLCYERGEEYKLHSDALSPGANQRIATVLVALNEGYEGGETSFPRLGVSWRGRAGEALHFENLNQRGAGEERMVHAGLPVRRGSKLLLSKWLRAAPLDLTGPPGRPF